MQIEIPFQALLDAVSSLEPDEKYNLGSRLAADLFADDEDTPEDLAEIQAARQDYAAGDYLTFEQYQAQCTAQR